MINRLKNLRKDILKLSQEEFAKKLDISRANMSSIEIGRVALTERNIKTICEKFNVKEDWLRNGNEPIFNNDYSNMNIGQRLKELRKNILNLTLKDFGNEISLSPGALGDIENGRRILQERHIKLICQTFNVNEDWLRNGNEPIFIEKETDALEEFFNEKNASPLARKIIKKYFNLNEKHREMFENFLKECINELEEEYKTEKENDKIKEFPKHEQKEMVKIIARGEGITEISKEELEELKRNSVRLDPEDYDKYF